ncbi:hypothetical protein MNBD_GAMMA16-1785 [hydrothermal vent metagenome]|uniref:DUF3379 domain-containing protein n=1 Tax=hydrothermal vent metagenome TaxID=652676 RepID=A0A3B0YSW1_9ZZZZ
MTDHNPTDKAIKSYYQKQNLSADKLQQMVDIAQLPKKPEEINWKLRWQTQRNISIAASLLLATVILFQWIFSTPTQQDLIASIAQEIAINHQKQFDSDFTETSYAELSNLMTKLNFKLVDPARLKEKGFQILGGRYCSLYGHIAAQVRLKNNAGVIFTLYQTGSHEAFKTLTEHTTQANGIEIEMWNEAGIFLGIAG